MIVHTERGLVNVESREKAIRMIELTSKAYMFTKEEIRKFGPFVELSEKFNIDLTIVEITPTEHPNDYPYNYKIGGNTND